MKFIHKKLAGGAWDKLTFAERMGNIGSEVERAISWRRKGQTNLERDALFRTHELLYLTIRNEKKFSRLKELTRVREALNDFFFGENIYKSSDELWRKYFYYFAYKARVARL